MRNATRKSEGLFTFLLKRLSMKYFRTWVKIGKIEAAKGYVEGVSGLRRVAVAAAGAFVCIALAAVGFVFLHVALILALDWSFAQAALFLLICGLVYLALGAGALCFMLSGTMWSKCFKVDEVVEKATRD